MRAFGLLAREVGALLVLRLGLLALHTRPRDERAWSLPGGLARLARDPLAFLYRGTLARGSVAGEAGRGRREAALVLRPFRSGPCGRDGAWWWRGVEILALPGGEAHRVRSSARLFFAPMLFLPGFGPLMIILPCALRSTGGRPALRIDNGIAPRRPVGGDHRPALARRLIEIAATRIIARGIIESRAVIGIRDNRATRAVDHRQLPIVIAIGVLRIADEIRCVGAGTVIIIAIAVIERFDERDRIVIALPGPGLGIAIIESVIRRRIAERVGKAPGIIGIGVAVAGIGYTHGADRPRRGQQCRRRRISWPGDVAGRERQGRRQCGQTSGLAAID